MSSPGCDECWFIALVHAAFQPHFTEHHLRPLNEILIDLNDLALGVGVWGRAFPCGPCGFARMPFFEKENVGSDFGVGVAFERIIGQANCAQQIGAIAHIFSQRGIRLVHCAARRDEKTKPPGRTCSNAAAKK